ncbi:MAG TPA: hypothetical protein VFE41_29710 [Acetobacteraceae bacterium]|nr:hypothetical protein [Acetobacteraceae bacterium]
MKTVTLDVQPLAGSLTDFARAWKTGKRDTAARINFATPDLLWNVLTTKRWDLLKAMAGQGSMSLREAARRVHRDVKGGHGDAHALLDAGVLRRTDDGRIKFPYDAVRGVHAARRVRVTGANKLQAATGARRVFRPFTQLARPPRRSSSLRSGSMPGGKLNN